MKLVVFVRSIRLHFKAKGWIISVIQFPLPRKCIYNRIKIGVLHSRQEMNKKKTSVCYKNGLIKEKND